jgi:hypothetical protein
VTFVSQAAIEDGLAHKLGHCQAALCRREHPRRHPRPRWCSTTRYPHIEVDPETYEVRADGELLTCEPATVVPMAQRYLGWVVIADGEKALFLENNGTPDQSGTSCVQRVRAGKSQNIGPG